MGGEDYCSLLHFGQRCFLRSSMKYEVSCVSAVMQQEGFERESAHALQTTRTVRRARESTTPGWPCHWLDNATQPFPLTGSELPVGHSIGREGRNLQNCTHTHIIHTKTHIRTHRGWERKIGRCTFVRASACVCVCLSVHVCAIFTKQTVKDFYPVCTLEYP